MISAKLPSSCAQFCNEFLSSHPGENAPEILHRFAVNCRQFNDVENRSTTFFDHADPVTIQDGLLLFVCEVIGVAVCGFIHLELFADRKSTRLNSSHVSISYAVFCLKTK